MGESNKQSISGFMVQQYVVKKGKDTEKVRLVLEADIDTVSAGKYDIGDVLKALWTHQAGEIDIGLTIFMDKDTDLPTNQEDEE